MIRTWMTTLILPLLACAATVRADPAGLPYDDPPGRVAMVDDAEGTVSLQPASSEEWTADVRNRPLTPGDRLWADQSSRAEVRAGSTTLRIGALTGVQLLALDDDRLQLKISTGTVGLHVQRLDAGQSIELDTPGGAVTIDRPGVYRFDVADGADTLRATVRRGALTVTTGSRSYPLGAGEFGEYGAGGAATTPSLPPSDAFDGWSDALDRKDSASVSAQYVSRELPGYAALDDYGQWTTDADVGAVWWPTVAAGFVPYRNGHWAFIRPWGWTWIDDAPWGFVPFHYGRWAFVHGRWGWCPGPLGPRAYFAPALVGWVGGAAWAPGYGSGPAWAPGYGRSPPVGWFPLGRNEIYVPSYHGSAAYARELNASNTTLTRTYLGNALSGANYRAAALDTNAARYANQRVAGAVTVVPRDTLQSGASVAAALRGQAPVDATHLPALSMPPVSAPVHIARDPRAVAAPPRAETWSRSVYAHVVPAASAARTSGVIRLVSAPSRPTAVTPGAATGATGATMGYARQPMSPAQTAAPTGPAILPRAYSDRPPYATRAPGTGTQAPSRQSADRPWTRPAMPAATPRSEAPVRAAQPWHEAPVPSSPPSYHPAPAPHASQGPSGGHAPGGAHGPPGRGVHLSYAPRGPVLPAPRATAYHPGHPAARRPERR